MAGISYNRFLHEVQEHRLVILEDNRFIESLQYLGEAFEDETLLSVISDKN